MKKLICFLSVTLFLTGCQFSSEKKIEPTETTVEIVPEENEERQLLNDFNSIFYNFNYKETNKNNYEEKIKNFMQEPSRLNGTFDDFKKTHMVSSYEGTEILSNESVNEEQEVVAFVHVKWKDDSFDGEYSILTKYFIKNQKITSRLPSSIYKKGTTSVTENGDTLHIEGEKIGEISYNEQQLGDREEKDFYGDGSATESTSKEEAASEITEEYYDSYEEAVRGELIKNGTKNHD